MNWSLGVRPVLTYAIAVWYTLPKGFDIRIQTKNSKIKLKKSFPERFSELTLSFPFTFEKRKLAPTNSFYIYTVFTCVIIAETEEIIGMLPFCPHQSVKYNVWKKRCTN